MSYQGRIADAFPAADIQTTRFDGDWRGPHGPGTPEDAASVRELLWQEHRGHLTGWQVGLLVAGITALGWALPLLG